ncbi:DUF2577 family protein [Paenibacillus sp. PL91]|uniref:DUF2577 family protein n=1 Tax=Paenibacillus sp. PL91 TaxID=2729538 RepID=UPI00145CF79D|nr:DUF2577 family protein [Paenibacillus sp. PL91]MBC9199761.1 hypothetical protein [Paenibacillus sp. PL91]
MFVDEGGPGSKLHSLIKRIGSNNDTQPEWATVKAISPELSVQIDDMKLELDSDDIAIPQRLQGALEVGDRVLVIGMQGGNAYAMIDRY